MVTTLNQMRTMTTMSHSEERPPVNTLNDGLIMAGENLPNHSTSLAGRGRFVASAMQHAPQFRTRQEAFRFCAYVLILVDINNLPDEPGEHTLAEVIEACKRV